MGQADHGRRQSAAGLCRLTPGIGSGLEKSAIRTFGQPPGRRIPVHRRGFLRPACRQGPGCPIERRRKRCSRRLDNKRNLLLEQRHSHCVAPRWRRHIVVQSTAKPRLQPGHKRAAYANTWFNPSCFVIPATPFVAGNAPAYLDLRAHHGRKGRGFVCLQGIFDSENKNSLRRFFVQRRQSRPVRDARCSQLHDCSDEPPQAALFGQITSTVNSPRQFQFGARFTF